MKRRVTIRPRAESDLQEAKLYYDLQRPGLGDDFLVSVGESIGYLEEHAERRSIYYRGFRRIITRRFPYKMFYRIENDRIVVFRILHVKQDHLRKLD
ncbi:MAG: type II toxin-antitoxin system RelE/ParE family toxin [Verrucomicrobia bacterium]|nr:type II toxin-antitoxin system RelE/ParE family toxin [Verrucomicrobiota bacterium]